MTMTMPCGESWPRFFYRAVSSLGDRLPAAMQAVSCREAWLQIEIMLYGDNSSPRRDLWLNTARVPGRIGWYDFAAYDGETPIMAAEIKVLAGHYLAKCLSGDSRWRDYLVEVDRRRPITDEEIQACDARWGLIPDAKRLLRFPGERYLILLLLDLDTSSLSPRLVESTTLRHQALNGVRFGRTEEWAKPVTGGILKVWSL